MDNLSKEERLMCVWCRQWVPGDTVTQLVAACTLGVGSQHRGPLVPESEWSEDRYPRTSNDLVSRLRHDLGVPRTQALCTEAADEIERLTRDLEDAREFIAGLPREVCTGCNSSPCCCDQLTAAETNTVLGVGVHQANAMLAESVRVSERRANRYWMALRKIMQIKGPPYLEAVEIATVALRSPEETISRISEDKP